MIKHTQCTTYKDFLERAFSNTFFISSVLSPRTFHRISHFWIPTISCVEVQRQFTSWLLGAYSSPVPEKFLSKAISPSLAFCACVSRTFSSREVAQRFTRTYPSFVRTRPGSWFAHQYARPTSLIAMSFARVFEKTKGSVPLICFAMSPYESHSWTPLERISMSSLFVVSSIEPFRSESMRFRMSLI